MIPDTCERLSAGDVDLYFYDELEPGARAGVADHLRTCEVCRTGLDELRVIGSALAARPAVAAPRGDDWSAFMSRLQAGLPASGEPAPPARPGRGQVIAYLAMAALLVLISASVPVLLGISDPPGGEQGTSFGGEPRANGTIGEPATTAGPAAVAAGRSPAHPPLAPAAAAFAALSEQHFARSKLVVLGLATKPADGAAADWAYERTLASSLLPETRLYRRAAQDRGLTAVAEVMSDLELVLLQASLGDARDAGTLPQLQRLIRKRDLVTKIQVVDAGF